MDTPHINSDNGVPKKRRGGMHVLRTVSIVLFVTVIIVAGWVRYNLYASLLRPATLTVKEQNILDSKLSILRKPHNAKEKHPGGNMPVTSDRLKPVPYTEEGARREISLTEKELNAIIARNPEMARRVAIDLSEGLVSIQLIIPVHDQVILFGGTTLRIHMGILLGFENNKPVVGLKGVSLGGIPLPNAWLGYLKGKNLVEEFASEGGFWELFSEGVRDIKVKEGHILIALKE